MWVTPQYVILEQKGVLAMEEKIYKKMYLHLFNAVSDVLAQEQLSTEAEDLLIQAQQECENIYIEGDE